MSPHIIHSPYINTNANTIPININITLPYLTPIYKSSFGMSSLIYLFGGGGGILLNKNIIYSPLNFISISPYTIIKSAHINKETQVP
jgi:hypothetical protein